MPAARACRRWDPCYRLPGALGLETCASTGTCISCPCSHWGTIAAAGCRGTWFTSERTPCRFRNHTAHSPCVRLVVVASQVYKNIDSNKKQSNEQTTEHTQDTYMVRLSNRLQEINKELDKNVTQDYRRTLINEQQEILRTLNRGSGGGLINPNPPPQLNPHGTLANLQNPYIILWHIWILINDILRPVKIFLRK